jgi:hypothetical protein
VSSDVSELEYTPEGYPKGNRKFEKEARETLERSRPEIDEVEKYFRESIDQLRRSKDAAEKAKVAE